MSRTSILDAELSPLDRLSQRESPFRRRRHLHRLELLDGEIEVAESICTLVRVALQQQLGQGEADQRDLGPEADPLADLQGLTVAAARLFGPAK